MLTWFSAYSSFCETSDNAFLFLLPNMINVPHSVNFALFPKTSNERQLVEAKLFEEDQ